MLVTKIIPQRLPTFFFVDKHLLHPSVDQLGLGMGVRVMHCLKNGSCACVECFTSSPSHPITTDKTKLNTFHCQSNPLYDKVSKAWQRYHEEFPLYFASYDIYSIYRILVIRNRISDVAKMIGSSMKEGCHLYRHPVKPHLPLDVFLLAI